PAAAGAGHPHERRGPPEERLPALSEPFAAPAHRAARRLLRRRQPVVPPREWMGANAEERRRDNRSGSRVPLLGEGARAAEEYFGRGVPAGDADPALPRRPRR